MQDLTITTIQAKLKWEDIDSNLEHFNKLLSESKQADIIVLPEMFNTGFTMNTSKVAEIPNGKTTKWMLSWSRIKKAVIIGSIIIKEDNLYYNRLIATYPNGNVRFYNKRHLFRIANEHDHFSEGTEKVILNIKGWNICPLICYDLRFPVWSRNKNNQIDLYIYIANWPSKRNHAWKTLLLARAIENIAYTIGVNRVGHDKNSIDYSGDSSVIDFQGKYIHKHKPNEESKNTISLSKKNLIDFRIHFPAEKDADKFNITI